MVHMGGPFGMVTAVFPPEPDSDLILDNHSDSHVTQSVLQNTKRTWRFIKTLLHKI